MVFNASYSNQCIYSYSRFRTCAVAQLLTNLKINFVKLHLELHKLLGMLVPKESSTYIGLMFITSIGIQQQLLSLQYKLAYSYTAQFIGGYHIDKNLQSSITFTRHSREQKLSEFTHCKSLHHCICYWQLGQLLIMHSDWV